ncbi:MAG: 3-isopropylmalate dehydrogenase, partial [Bacteroidetes bacterium]
SVDKSNALEVSVLWREVVTKIHQQSYSDVVLSHMYVDNAAMQIIVNPSQFDVLLTGNMFGDILSDLASTLVGSLGMLPSACLGGTVGLFEPVHGSAPDIAGMNKANPIGAILSSAMLFEELKLVELAARIRKAVDQALSDGFRTPDILEDDSIEVGTIEMANVIADRLTEVAV